MIEIRNGSEARTSTLPLQRPLVAGVVELSKHFSELAKVIFQS